MSLAMDLGLLTGLDHLDRIRVTCMKDGEKRTQKQLGELYAILQQVSFFDQFPTAAVWDLTRVVQCYTTKAWMEVFKQGQQGEAIFFIVAGKGWLTRPGAFRRSLSGNNWVHGVGSGPGRALREAREQRAPVSCRSSRPTDRRRSPSRPRFSPPPPACSRRPLSAVLLDPPRVRRETVSRS